MVSRLSEGQAQFLRDHFSDAQLLAQEEVGNLSIEDVQQVFSIDQSGGAVNLDVVVGAIETAANGTSDFITGYIGTGSQFTGGSLDDFAQAFSETLADNLGLMADRIAGLESSITGYIDEQYSAIVQTVEEFNSSILHIPRAVATRMEEVVEESERGIKGLIMGAAATQLEAEVQANEAILSEIVPIVESVANVTEAVIDQAQGFATALRETIPDLGTAIVDGMGTVGGVITAGLGAAFQGALAAIGADKLLDMFSLLGTIGDQVAKELGGVEDVEIREGSWDNPLSVSDAFSAVLAGLPWVGNIIQVKHPAEFERMRLQSFAWTRPSPLDPSTTLEYIRRFPGSEAELQVNLEAAGFDDGKIAQLMQIRFTPLALSENVTALRRGFISPEVFEDKLRALSLADEDIDLAERLSLRLPPLGDLIRMVVRDVFDPDVVREGNLRADIDTFPFETAEQLGLDREWAERYWMAHWELPSLQQGFEMLHRLPDWDAKLEALFKAADLAPGYWDDMKAISYRPFTRVDVRRMYAFKQLDRAGVVRSYKDIGYDDEKAELLTQFTVDYVDAQTKVTRAKERDLSKSDIIGLFNDGITNAQETTDYLMQLGYSEDEATVLVKREEIQEERKERKADIEVIIDQAKIKVLTFDQAQDQLAALDLSPTETKKAIAGLVRAIEARTRTPSKADLDNWLNLGLLTQVTYEEEMQALGYPDRYIALYIEAMQAETEDDILGAEVREAGKREPRIVTKGQLDSLYIAEIIDDAEYQTGLANLGYRAGDIANFLIQATLKLEERLQAERDRIARGEVAPVRERTPNRTLIGKMFIKGLIGIDAYEQGLVRLGFSPENVELLKRLITDKVASSEAEV